MSTSTSSAANTTSSTSDTQHARPDRRTRRREQGRSQVYAAAVELFVEQGFDNTTMEQIADRADVARATVFNYFQRKTAFLEEWMRRRRERAANAVQDENLEGWPLDRILRRYMTEMARISEETRPETVALMDATSHGLNILANPVLGDDLAAFVRKAQRSGDAPRSMDARQAGVLTAIAYFAVLTEWISEEPAPFDLREELLAMLDNILFGIFTPKGDGAVQRRPRRRR